MILSNKEYLEKVEKEKERFATYTNEQLIELYNTFSMAYVVHENENDRNNDLIACTALKNMILAKMN